MKKRAFRTIHPNISSNQTGGEAGDDFFLQATFICCSALLIAFPGSKGDDRKSMAPFSIISAANSQHEGFTAVLLVQRVAQVRPRVALFWGSLPVIDIPFRRLTMETSSLQARSCSKEYSYKSI